jgi:hypothetical protein
MTKSTDTLAKPRPVSAKALPTTVQMIIRVTPESRDAIKALADRENLTVQQLGHYAWSLALQAYGLPPIPEALT